MRLAILILLLTPLAAHADPGSILFYIGTYAVTAATVAQVALIIGSAVYGSAQQR